MKLWKVRARLYLAIILAYIGWVLMLPAKLIGIDYTAKPKRAIQEAKKLLEETGRINSER